MIPVKVMDYKVPVEKLRIEVDKQEFGLKGQTTSVLPVPKGLEVVVGNEEAISTVLRGLEDKSPTTNIIITGDPGVGKSLLTNILLEDYCKKQPNDHLTDKVVFYNFKHEKQPIIAELPKGTAYQFAKSVDDTLSQLVIEAMTIGQNYMIKKNVSQVKYRIMEKKVIDDLEKKYKIPKKPILDKNNQQRVDKNGQPLSEYDPKTQQDCDNLVQMLHDLSIVQSTNDTACKKESRTLTSQKKKEFGSCMGKALKELHTAYGQNLLIKEYLDDFVINAKEDFDLFLGEGLSKDAPQNDYGIEKYRVNVVVDHTHTIGIPYAKIERPDERTLLGEIKGDNLNEESKPPQFCVDIGKMIECDGGIVFLDEKFTGIFRHGLGLEQRLLTILEERKARVSGNQNYLLPTQQIETSEVSAQTKIVACMNLPDYYICQDYFPQLMERFAYKAHFQSRMENNVKHRKQVVSFVATEIRAHNENEKIKVPHFSEDGLAALLEHMSRQENQHYLTTRLRTIRQLLFSAAELARQENKPAIERQHVLAARELQNKGCTLYKIEQDILAGFGVDGRVLLLTTGEKTGQINGLLYYSINAENYAFGSSQRYRFVIKPGYYGRGLKFTDIEKASDLTGPTHNKGVELLKSFYNNLTNELRERKMISGLAPGLEVDMSVPESWSGRDGPSATAAQAYAFLSELTGIPIKQGIAVTGAMGPDGEVTLVGGLNEKIEGWYKILAKRGHLGKEAGVMIPAANILECNLSDDCIKAVKKGEFSVYYHKDIRTGVEVILGKSWDDVLQGIKNTFDKWEKMLEEDEVKRAKRKKEIKAALP